MNVDIESIKRRLLVKYPFFGSVVANSNFQEDLTVETAGTDGENIYYNSSFVNSLNEEEQTFLFAHEICHIAFDHILRSEGKDKHLWNIATDSVINAFLMQDGLPLIEGGVDIKEAINYDAEEMYEKLLKEKQETNNKENLEENNQSQTNQQNTNPNNNGQTQNQQQKVHNSETTYSSDIKDESKDVGHDTHSLWEKVVERKNSQEQNPKNSNKDENKKESNPQNLESKSKDQENTKDHKGLFDRIFNRKKETNQSQEKEENQEQKDSKEDKSKKQKKKQEEIKRLAGIGEKETFKQNKIERKKQLEELRDSLIKQSHASGSGSDRIDRKITDIGTAEPLIDWRRLLKEAVKYDLDWSYKNASIEDGVVTPYLEEMPKPETEIVLDTSGSIDENLLRNFLRECKNILQTSKVKVGCFDDEFYGFTEIRNENDIDNMKFIGGGGTNFDAAVNAFSRRVENKIIFTDGWADMPEKVIDAIWIVFGGRTISPKGGKVINITDEQLDRLMINSFKKGMR